MRPLKRLSTGERTFLPWAIAAGLVLAVGLIYGQTLGFGFLDYDDQWFITRCPPVKAGLTANSIAWAFTDGPGGDWYPLAMLSHMLDCQLYGLHPAGHFLTNLLLHAATVVALFFLLRQMTGELGPSALVAALLAVHPQHVESVAWLAERRDVLSGLLFMLSLLAYLAYVRHARSPARYLLVVALVALGLMAKPMLVTLPGILLLLDYWPLGRFGQALDLPPAATGNKPESFGWLVLEKLPLVALAAADTARTLATHVSEAGEVTLAERIAYAPVAVVMYLVHAFYPRGLVPFYPYPAGGVAAWQVAGSLAVVLGLSLAAILARRRCPYLLVGWFWFLGMLVPVLGMISVSRQAMADRYMYLPGVGLYLAVVFGGWRWAAHSAARGAVLGGAAAVSLFVLALLADEQTSYWRGGEVLWTHSIAVTGSNPEAELGLAEADLRAGRLDQAAAHYRLGLAGGHNPEAINNFGVVLLKLHKLDEALAVFRRGVETNPQSSTLAANLGVALLELKRRDEAVEQFRRAIEMDPKFLEPRLNLARALAEQGHYDAARAVCRAALQIAPGNRAVGAMLARLAKLPAAGSEP